MTAEQIITAVEEKYPDAFAESFSTPECSWVVIINDGNGKAISDYSPTIRKAWIDAMERIND